MQLNEINFEGQPPVDAYAAGYFRVNEQVLNGPLLIAPQGITDWQGLDDWDAIIKMAADFDVIFIGMGADIAALPVAAKTALEAANVPYELMASPAACRTYNVLLSEDRRVAIAALPI